MKELEEGVAVLVAEDAGVGLGEVAEGGRAFAGFEAVGAGAVLALLGGWAFGFGAVFAGDAGFFFFRHLRSSFRLEMQKARCWWAVGL